jgi:hypothetical protein
MTSLATARTNAMIAATFASIASFAFVLALMPPAAFVALGAGA